MKAFAEGLKSRIEDYLGEVKLFWVSPKFHPDLIKNQGIYLVWTGFDSFLPNRDNWAEFFHVEFHRFELIVYRLYGGAVWDASRQSDFVEHFQEVWRKVHQLNGIVVPGWEDRTAFPLLVESSGGIEPYTISGVREFDRFVQIYQLRYGLIREV